jgi:hypothetical protein
MSYCRVICRGGAETYMQISEYFLVRFQVFTVAYMKMTAFWDIAPRSFVEIYWRFKGAYCLHHQGDEWAACKKVGGKTGAGQTRSKLGQTKGWGGLRGGGGDTDTASKVGSGRVGVPQPGWGGKRYKHGSRQENTMYGMRTRRNK